MTHDQRILIIATNDAGLLATFNGHAASWDPGPAGDETFGHWKLSADGSGPATHVGTCLMARTAWGTAPMQFIEAVVGNAHATGYRITALNADRADDCLAGTIERYELDAIEGWGWHEVGTGAIREFALSEEGLQPVTT